MNRSVFKVLGNKLLSAIHYQNFFIGKSLYILQEWEH